MLVRELLQNSWDETGKKLGEGNDRHGSPRLCHEAYDHHLLKWADGADIRVADMEPAHVQWLERPGLFVGPMEKLKYVQFIRLEGDLVIPQDMALKDPGPEYPGWTTRPSGHPKAALRLADPGGSPRGGQERQGRRPPGDLRVVEHQGVAISQPLSWIFAAARRSSASRSTRPWSG